MFSQNILEELFTLLLSKNVRHNIPDWLTNNLPYIQFQIKVKLARTPRQRSLSLSLSLSHTHARARARTHSIRINYVTLLIRAVCISARQSTSPGVYRGGRVADHEWQHEQSSTTDRSGVRVRRINRYTMECGTDTVCFANVFTRHCSRCSSIFCMLYLFLPYFPCILMTFLFFLSNLFIPFFPGSGTN
jgi:hypothetical protein